MTGELYLAVQDQSCKGTDIISFLEQLLEEIEGRLLVVRDGAPVHRSRPVKEWLAQGAVSTPGVIPRPTCGQRLWPA